MNEHGEISELLRAYASQPVGQGELADADAVRQQKNSLCGDDICVALKITDGHVEVFRYTGHPSMFTLAAASMLAEVIEGTSVHEVLTRGYGFMKELWFEVSPRRQRSAVSALLATRNAIHVYLQDDKEDTYEDVLREEDDIVETCPKTTV